MKKILIMTALMAQSVMAAQAVTLSVSSNVTDVKHLLNIGDNFLEDQGASAQAIVYSGSFDVTISDSSYVINS